MLGFDYDFCCLNDVVKRWLYPIDMIERGVEAGFRKKVMYGMPHLHSLPVGNLIFFVRFSHIDEEQL
jgi:hypothetical protein